MASPEHPRFIIPNFLSLDLCKELEFIHKSCSSIGYRPNTYSTTLSFLIATNSAHLIMPFVTIRERLREKAEELFGCEFELVVEFTGLLSWCKGASIGWHSDDDRPYLKQRDFTAVCYLNSYGEDFKGGLFHFRDYEPTTVVPMAGDVVMYTADSRNIHSVDEITDGERLTLTLWFSRDWSHNEDAKLISSLSKSLLHSTKNGPPSNLPLPASSSMYWFPPDQALKQMSGFDTRIARIYVLGYDVCPSRGSSCSSAMDSSYDLSKILEEPLLLIRGDEFFDEEYCNISHVLQVVQYYCWKAHHLQTSENDQDRKNGIPCSQAQREETFSLRLLFLKDKQLAESAFGHMTCYNHVQHPFDWAGFSAAVTAWEVYNSKLWKELLVSLPHWTSHESIFAVPSVDLEIEK